MQTVISVPKYFYSSIDGTKKVINLCEGDQSSYIFEVSWSFYLYNRILYLKRRGEIKKLKIKFNRMYFNLIEYILKFTIYYLLFLNILCQEINIISEKRKY